MYNPYLRNNLAGPRVIMALVSHLTRKNLIMKKETKTQIENIKRTLRRRLKSYKERTSGLNSSYIHGLEEALELLKKIK